MPRDEYYRELAAGLRRTIAIDATCWHGVDPRTRLLTTASPEELLQRGFVSAETLSADAQAALASEYELHTWVPKLPGAKIIEGVRPAVLMLACYP